MSRIRGKNTTPELMIRRWLWAKGYRYRLHSVDLPGKPDIVFPGRKKIILVNGCFWHRHSCKYFKWPRKNAEFWKVKIEGNVLRDKKNLKRLTELGWQVLIIWECETKEKNIDFLYQKIEEFLTPHLEEGF